MAAVTHPPSAFPLARRLRAPHAPPVPEIAAEPRLTDSAPELAERLDRIRNRQGAVALGSGVAIALLVLLVWLAIEMPLDWLVELPVWARALFLVGGLGGAAFALWRLGLRPLLHQPDDDRVALAIERALPQFRSRFIASVQLARRTDGVSGSIVRALLTETTALAQTARFETVVKTGLLGRCSGAALVAALLAGLLWWLGGRASWPLLQRACLVNVPVPRKTMITAITGNRVIAIGDDLRIDATAAGIIPKSGRLWLKTAAGKKQDFTLDADPANKVHFSRTLRSVQENFEYSVELGDNRTAWFRVRARPRPTITNLTCEQQWPAYTHLPPRRRAPGELKLLAGSKLAVRVKSGAVLRASTMRLVGADRDKTVAQAALRPDSKPTGEWLGEIGIPAKDVSGLTFDLADDEGVESRTMAVYPIDVIPDQPPGIRILWPPRREELVTQKATMLISFEAKDDFGVARVLLHCAVNWTEGAAHKTLDLDLGGEEAKLLTRRFEWKLERLAPPIAEGDVIDFWFEARDANNVTGPGVTILPEHYQARVVSEADKRADLANRFSDTLQGLNDVRQGQEDLAKRLGDLIHEKPAQP